MELADLEASKALQLGGFDERLRLEDAQDALPLPTRELTSAFPGGKLLQPEQFLGTGAQGDLELLETTHVTPHGP